MAKRKFEKKWRELSISEKRNALWKVLNSEKIDFKSIVGEERWTEFMMRTKDIDFEKQADIIRKDIVFVMAFLCKDKQKINMMTNFLRLED